MKISEANVLGNQIQQKKILIRSSGNYPPMEKQAKVFKK